MGERRAVGAGEFCDAGVAGEDGAVRKPSLNKSTDQLHHVAEPYP